MSQCCYTSPLDWSFGGGRTIPRLMPKPIPLIPVVPVTYPTSRPFAQDGGDGQVEPDDGFPTYAWILLVMFLLCVVGAVLAWHYRATLSGQYNRLVGYAIRVHMDMEFGRGGDEDLEGSGSEMGGVVVEDVIDEEEGGSLVQPPIVAHLDGLRTPAASTRLKTRIRREAAEATANLLEV